MKIGWLLGWAIPENWFAGFARESFPEADHVFVKPSATALDQLESHKGLDWVVGYSLGSLLLLQDAARAQRLGRVALLAPIFAFSKEEGLGGKAARAEIRLLDRRLRRDPAQGVAQFYLSAGLSHASAAAREAAARNCGGLFKSSKEGRLLSSPNGLPSSDLTVENYPLECDNESLVWGLERLRTSRVEPPLPHNWIGWCGTQDALLDGELLHSLDPRIACIEGGTHHPRMLVQAFSVAVSRMTAGIPP